MIVSDSEIRRLNEGIVLRGEMTGKDIPTKFDLSSIGDLKDEEIYNLIESTLCYSLDNSLLYSKLNRVYQKVLKYMQEELFYTRKELSRFIGKTFHSKEDILLFLRDTSRPRGILNCVIAKVFQAFLDADEEFNERVRIVKEKTMGVIEGKLIINLHIIKRDDDKWVGKTSIQNEQGVIRKIVFTIKKRLKSTYSSVSKEIRDPKYFTADMISDWYGATIEVEKKEDILPLMQLVADLVFKRGNFEVKNDKGMFSEDEVSGSIELREGFRKIVLQGTKKRDKIESGDVKDIKLVTPKEKDEGIENMSLEIKFVLSENKNEEGLNMHGIYNYMKKISERIRLEGYVTHAFIELVAQKFLEHLPHILYGNPYRIEKEGDNTLAYKKELFHALREEGHILSSYKLINNHTLSRIDDLIVQGLVGYFKGKLIPVHKKGERKIHYTNKRGLRMSKGDNENVGAVGTELYDTRE